jgi:hypothetical protein
LKRGNSGGAGTDYQFGVSTAPAHDIILFPLKTRETLAVEPVEEALAGPTSFRQSLREAVNACGHRNGSIFFNIKRTVTSHPATY